MPSTARGDHRSPSNAQKYRQEAKEFLLGPDGKTLQHPWFENRVRYVDTHFLIGAVFDSAEDGSHYDGDNGDAEAVYLLWRILRDE